MAENHGNRGRALQKKIIDLFKLYEASGIHCQENQPARTHEGLYINKHGFDFQVFYKYKFYAFDAKMCQGDKIDVKTNFKIHQIKALYDIERHGGEGFFMVYFKPGRLNKITATEANNMIINKVNTCEYSEQRDMPLDFLGVLNDNNR